MLATTFRLCVATLQGKPGGFVIRRIVGENDLWIAEYVSNYGVMAVETVSIMEFQRGRVVHETQYFARPFEAPAWRSQWVETDNSLCGQIDERSAHGAI